jgi:YidC/Oxa1 family membrane protein insertase
MEQSRMLLAIALSLLVFILWNFLFVEKPDISEPIPSSEVSEVQKENRLSGQDTDVRSENHSRSPERIQQSGTIAATPAAPHPDARTITINTPLYTVKISESGAVLTHYSLNEYREVAGADAPLKELISPETNPLGTLQVEFDRDSLPGMANAFFNVERESDTLDVNDRPETLNFSWKSPSGITVEKSYTFSPDTYIIAFDIGVLNQSEQSIQDNLVFTLAGLAPDGASRYSFEGPSAFIDNALEKIKVGDIENRMVINGTLTWIAVQDRYFMSSMILPENPVAQMRLLIDRDNILKSQYISPSLSVEPGSRHHLGLNLFFGPKQLKTLQAIGNNLDKAVNFGWFDFIGKPCLWFMNFLYGIIPNYGVAIIILTLIMKALFWPLGTKSYKSMNEMKKLQPLMAEIREKHKDDRKRMNEEIMGLYKVYKINPLGGCLPMVAQMPVFFALYRMLYEAIELRHAPFFGWISDLSAPDRLFNFSFSIPFMQAPYGIPVLTIIMGATMLIQQKLQPPPGDPAQAKMMMLMPVIFTFIFINFSSGLVLYWLISNVISIAQQYYISKKNA